MAEKIITADMHTHLLEYNTKPEKYWKAVQKAGLNAVAITEHIEHNPKKAFERVFEKKPKDMLLIPGMEMFTTAGHVLAYSHSPEIYEIPELQVKGIKMQKAADIAEENNITLCFAHPWGYEHDSIAYRTGLTELRKFAVHGNIGVEVYNGMIGELAESLLKSKWVKKPLNFFAYIEKNRITSKAGIGRLMGGIKKRLDRRAVDIVQRNINMMEFGEEARFIVAGSDAHSAARIGCGLIKLRVEEPVDEKKFLEALRDKKNVLWAGPPSVETGKGVFERKKSGIKKMELLLGLKYVAKKAIVRKGRKDSTV